MISQAFAIANLSCCITPKFAVTKRIWCDITLLTEKKQIHEWGFPQFGKTCSRHAQRRLSENNRSAKLYTWLLLCSNSTFGGVIRHTQTCTNYSPRSHVDPVKTLFNSLNSPNYANETNSFYTSRLHHCNLHKRAICSQSGLPVHCQILESNAHHGFKSFLTPGKT